MTVLTEETKARNMRYAFGKLAGEYIMDGRLKESVAVQKAIMALDGYNESLAKLHDLILAP